QAGPRGRRQASHLPCRRHRRRGLHPALRAKRHRTADQGVPPADRADLPAQVEGVRHLQRRGLGGDPLRGDPQVRPDRQADLIVMAHHAREIDPEEAELGSTVEQVVLRAACPVASVNHPDKVADLV
ncbi:MAG: hypothetical protein EHM15_11605, partial [Desulfobacteraceae bacterium]